MKTINSAAFMQRNFLRFIFLLNVVSQNQADVLRQGTAILVCLFPERFQQIVVERDADTKT